MGMGSRVTISTGDGFLLKWVVRWCAIWMFTAYVAHAQPPPDFEELNSRLLALIADKTTTDQVLLESISRLGRVTEPPAFWNRIADDSGYSRQHRTRAVFALFRRHGERRADVPSLGKCLGKADWLRESIKERVTSMFGPLPAELRPGHSTYSISVLGGPKIYITFPGDVDLVTFKTMLKGNIPADLKADPVIVHIGYGDDYDEWLRGPLPGQQEKSNGSESGRR